MPKPVPRQSSHTVAGIDTQRLQRAHQSACPHSHLAVCRSMNAAIQLARNDLALGVVAFGMG